MSGPQASLTFFEDFIKNEFKKFPIELQQTKLIDAIEVGSDYLIDAFLLTDIDVNFGNSYDNANDRETKNPLIVACNLSQPKTVKKLLAKGADVNVETPWGSTPIMFASQKSSDECVNLLLTNGAKINTSKKHICDYSDNSSQFLSTLIKYASLELSTKELIDLINISILAKHMPKKTKNTFANLLQEQAEKLVPVKEEVIKEEVKKDEDFDDMPALEEFIFDKQEFQILLDKITPHLVDLFQKLEPEISNLNLASFASDDKVVQKSTDATISPPPPPPSPKDGLITESDKKSVPVEQTSNTSIQLPKIDTNKCMGGEPISGTVKKVTGETIKIDDKKENSENCSFKMTDCTELLSAESKNTITKGTDAFKKLFGNPVKVQVQSDKSDNTVIVTKSEECRLKKDSDLNDLNASLNGLNEEQRKLIMNLAKSMLNKQ